MIQLLKLVYLYFRFNTPKRNKPEINKQLEKIFDAITLPLRSELPGKCTKGALLCFFMNITFSKKRGSLYL